jgi:hypothetical protein
MRRITIMGLAVATWLAATGGTALAAPGNDAFEHATALGDARAAVDGTVDGATTQPGDPTPWTHDVWYAITPASAAPLAIELTRADHVDSLPAVYAGADVSHLRPAGSADPAGAPRIRLDPQAGTTYWIAVGNAWNAARTSFTLRVRRATRPRNDAFDTPRGVRIPGLYHGNMADATGELGERGPVGAKPTHSVWYRFTARYTGRVTVEATGRSCLPGVAVSTGTELDALHVVAAHAGVVRFRATRGQRYNVQLDCPYPGIGDYTLDLSDGSIAGKGVGAEVRSGQTVKSLRRHGLELTVSTRRETAVDIDLVLSHRAMRRLGLHDRVIGHVRGHLDANDRIPATIRLSQAARRALTGRAGLTATARITLRSNAPHRVLEVPVSLPD